MNSQEDTWEKLDSEFDHYLVDMRPYVLKLPHKSERQRCALWIKKLCDPSGSGSGIMGRRNRNMYAKLLLHMLRRGLLEGPFTHRPEPGILKTLPTYMSIYFDEPLTARVLDQSAGGLPDWVSGELGATEESWTPPPRERSPSPTSPQHTHRRRSSQNGNRPTQARSAALTRRSAEENHAAFRTDDWRRRLLTSSDDSDLETRLNSWNLGIENPRYLRANPVPVSPIGLKASLGKNSTFCDELTSAHIQEKELEIKTKVLEAGFHEEKLKMQQKHDADVQKVLDRKNGEIEELKALYRNKQKESEETIRKLEKKVQSLVRESQVVRESKEKQITELKKMSDQSAESLNNEWEKKLHNSVAQMEQEKFDLQKKHTDNIQELLQDTNLRLAKMEAEYGAQTKATDLMVKELEARVQQLTVEVENSNTLRQKVAQEKAELEVQIAAISSELQEANRRNNSLLREKEALGEQHEQSLRKMQAKHNADLGHLQKEHALSAAKASEVIEELEQTVSQFRLQLQDSELSRQKQLREQESKFQQERSNLEHINEKKVRHLQGEAEKDRAEAKKIISRLEDALREKEERLQQQEEQHRSKAQQAEQALDQFRRQVELSSEKAYSDMKQQMEKVEADLARSKSLREKQAREFAWQLEELKQRYEQQIVELKVEHEQEKTHLFQQHNAEKDSLVRDHEREIESLEKQSRAAVEQLESQTQEWRQRDSQTIAELEAQVHHLREELVQLGAQRKQQLLELGLLREEERQRAAQEHEAALGRLRAEMDRMKLDMERSHAAEKELALEKTNSRLKQTEKEYSQKLAKSSQSIAELQAGLSAAREESRRQQRAAETHLQEAAVRWEEDRKQTLRSVERESQALEDKIAALQSQLHAAEKKLVNKDLEKQEEVTHIRQECEAKIKGLMPVALRQELEDTIASLKSQVNFLQKRAAVLQEDLDACRSRR
ncbi:centrosomal protein of 112 kDa isoform X2 [Amia ocellicauda]|uniref:centrosomal protein of 112 kDa isoform X1 n=1 Tax=Amia ocellicauda TaxID=2972642 RepID=UPI0034641E28